MALAWRIVPPWIKLTGKLGMLGMLAVTGLGFWLLGWKLGLVGVVCFAFIPMGVCKCLPVRESAFYRRYLLAHVRSRAARSPVKGDPSQAQAAQYVLSALEDDRADRSTITGVKAFLQPSGIMAAAMNAGSTVAVLGRPGTLPELIQAADKELGFHGALTDFTQARPFEAQTAQLVDEAGWSQFAAQKVRYGT